MKVIIAGGRNFVGSPETWKIIEDLNCRYIFSEIVSGKAKGADTYGENYAKENHLETKVFPAKWKNLDEKPCIIGSNNYGEYNKLAGHNRNKKMAEYADAIILFKGGKGTANMRNLAKEFHLEVLYDAEV